MLTKLDVLSGLKVIKVATVTGLKAKISIIFPMSKLHRVEPVYRELPGWEEDITACTSFDSLPENARRYIEFIEEESGVKVSLVSNGPDRKNTFLR